MEFLFESAQVVVPRLSIVLLDWSCRESFHVLEYLNQQTAPRDAYEVIWIEYYGRRAQGIEDALKASARSRRAPNVDRWIVMGIPEHIYYHKHLMYNVGIVTARGQIITICDSDAMMRPTFVESILREFERDPQIVLHMDEVRSHDPRFYPFTHPTFEEVVGPGVGNWTGTTTTGLVDTEDQLHSRNYGACMSARREDLIAVGGADEHVDYVGHICGPYDLTFRLVNAGHREVWHEHEFLYHTWHPGQAGDRNYLGPHDGRHMSTTALETRVTGRVRPLIENPAIEMLRLTPDCAEPAQLLARVIPQAALESWTVERLEQQRKGKVSVSIIILSHNKPQFVREAVQSVLDQTYQDWEAILMDSGVLLAQGFFDDIKDPRIRIMASGETPDMPQSRNMASWCFNKVLSTGSIHGELIMYLCDDDILYKDAFETFWEYYVRHSREPQAMYASQDVGVVDAEGNTRIIGKRTADRPAGRFCGGRELDRQVDYLQFCHTAAILDRMRDVYGTTHYHPEGKEAADHADGIFMEGIGAITKIHNIDKVLSMNRLTVLSVNALPAALNLLTAQGADMNQRLARLETDVGSLSSQLARLETDVASVSSQRARLETDAGSHYSNLIWRALVRIGRMYDLVNSYSRRSHL